VHDSEVTTRARGPLLITWLGHSTVLLELDGVRLLTDPVLRTRVAHLRRVAPNTNFRVLEDLDTTLISHLHYDHLDVPSLERLGRSQRFVVPRGAGRFLRRHRFSRVAELGVGDELSVGPLVVRATHAEHHGRRHPFGAKAPAVGYLIRGSVNVYFAGDTDLFDGMDELAPGLDVALLPIAGWGPRIPRGHLDPFRAARALVRLRPRCAVPIHWGTYRRIGMDRDSASLRTPADAFVEFTRELAPEVDVRVLAVGGTLAFSVPPAAASAGSRPHAGAGA
jgi:L-ascorbate metabolism protein UlaG (beta-lactamase superfamily)